MSEPFDDLDEIEFEIVTMTDDDGEEIEFSIVDNVTSGSNRYLLVVETALLDDDDDEASEALILKEISINSDDVTYELVEEDAEFDRIAEMFAKKGDEYEVRID